MKTINYQNALQEKSKNKQKNKSLKMIACKNFAYWLFLLLFFAFSCSDSTSSGGGTEGTGDSRFLLETGTDEEEVNYTDNFVYGTIKPNLSEGEEVTSFTIISVNPTNDKITINSTNGVGVITVAPGLRADNYSFQVSVAFKNQEGNDQTSITDSLSLVISPITITRDDFTIPRDVTELTNYSNVNYGTIIINNSDITVTFAIESSNAPNNEIAIDPTTGAITVAPGLVAGEYTFRVRISGTGNYGESVITDELKFFVTGNPIEKDDFRVSLISESKDFGYTLFTYGTIELDDPDVTANFTVVNITAPDDVNVPPNTIRIEGNRVITIASGLVAGEYTFVVRATGIEEYGGVTASDPLTLTIARRPITANDFTIPSSVTEEVDYANTNNYGTIIARGGVTATFALASSDAPGNEIAIDEKTGAITVIPGLPSGTYSFKVRISGIGNYGSSFETEELKFSVTDNSIARGDFTVSPTTSSRAFRYSTFTYGKVEPVDPVKATFVIVRITGPDNATVPPNVIRIDENNDIIVAPGLVAGEYTFQVQATGSGDYGGTADSEVLRLTITPRQITSDDFTTPPDVNEAFDYTTTVNYGRIELNDEVTATFDIASSTAPGNEITIDPITGEITVAPGLEIRQHIFTIKVTGTGNYTGDVTTKALRFSITRSTITKDQYSVNINFDALNTEIGYSSFTYMTVELINATGTFEIENNSAPNAIAINETSGEVTVAPGLGVGSYSFEVKIVGRGEYVGVIVDLGTYSVTINRKTISENDFITPNNNVTREAGYTDTSYGQITFNPASTPEVTADFAVVESPFPTGQIDVDETGRITIPNQKPLGTYTFKVSITGSDNYRGSITKDFTFVVNRIPITKSDFNITRTAISRVFGYNDTTLARIEFKDSGGTFSYFIPFSTATLPGVRVDSSGTVTTITGADAGDYAFQVVVSGEGNYEGRFTLDFTFKVERKSISRSDVTLSGITKDPRGDFLVGSTKKEGFTDTSFGRIVLNPGVTATFEIFVPFGYPYELINGTKEGDNTFREPPTRSYPNGRVYLIKPVVNIASDGTITVQGGEPTLYIYTYRLYVVVTGTGNYTGSFRIDVSLVVSI